MLPTMKRPCVRPPVVAPGNLKSDEILEQLGTGLYISNLHYLNWSDLTAGRITGMTPLCLLLGRSGQNYRPD